MYFNLSRNAVNDVRDEFALQYGNKNFIQDKTGVKCVEIVGASFLADEPTIFGAINHDYIKRELDWYDSHSLYVKDIPGDTPKIWEMVSDDNGKINSNYGWCIYSQDNYQQYQNCRKTLLEDKDSRRAIMIYNRPKMQLDYNANGMSDFMCTNSVQYLIRDNKLIVVVNMRSNDAWAGYRNDFAWQKIVQMRLIDDYNTFTKGDLIEPGNILWNAGSLHIYEAQFYLLDNYIKTGGEFDITKREYDERNA